MKVAAVVLAAGVSRRLGRPKQDILFGGESLLERTVRVAILAGLDPVYVIIAPSTSQPPPPAAITLINAEAAEGMASSIRTGILAASEIAAHGAVILACDQPTVTPEHLRLLLAESNEGTQIVASTYAGRKGVPAYFPVSAFASLLELKGDTGARDLVSSAYALTLANGELDIDTPDDLTRAHALFAECMSSSSTLKENPSS